ncbi:MAG: helix-turn-helix domain-containing protein [Actinobacteria bacterium]|nr:helix-turn-helix domain-containing protein [Actinomycetota bacterium]
MTELMIAPAGGVLETPAEAFAEAAPEAQSGDVVAAFCRIADAFNPLGDVDTAARLVAAASARLTASARCCVYLRDGDSGLFRGRVAFGDLAGEDERVRRLVCGTAADRFTSEIVESRRPVMIADARHDRRPVRAAMVDWGVSSVLGVPMLDGEDVVGLIFLDDAGRRREFSAAAQEAAAGFGRLAGVAMSHALQAQGLRQAKLAAEQQTQALKRARVLDERLTQALVDAQGVNEIAAAVTAATDRCCAVFDDSLRRIGGGGPGAEAETLRALERLGADLPEVREVLEGETSRTAIIDAIPTQRMMHRVLISPVSNGGRVVGCVALLETGGRFSLTDAAAARRAAMAVGIDFAARRRKQTDRAHAREVLVRDLIGGTGDPARATARADYVGLSLDRGAVVASLKRRHGGGPPLATDAVEEACMAEGVGHWEGATTAEAGAIIVIVPIEESDSRQASIATVRARLNEAALRLGDDGEVLVALSGVCADAPGFRLAFEESQQVLGCLEELGSGGSLVSSLAADDLGPARLFLSAGDRSAARRFCADVLGPLNDVDDPKAVDLLVTADTYYSCGRSVRRTASRLEVHGNTVRYRLARIKQLTGRDLLGDPTGEVDFFVALMLLSLEQRVPRDIVVRIGADREDEHDIDNL